MLQSFFTYFKSLFPKRVEVPVAQAPQGSVSVPHGEGAHVALAIAVAAMQGRRGVAHVSPSVAIAIAAARSQKMISATP